jgi:His/Glu/Gln/Arg/opine family amino acid ABC transporter permease subunit
MAACKKSWMSGLGRQMNNILSWQEIGYILAGSITSLKYMVCALCIGFILGLILALIKISQVKSLKWFADAYTSVFRGTPLLVQLSLVYFGVPQLFDYQISTFAAGVIAFSLNSAAYLSEVLRAGVVAVDVGQFEAAKSLHISYFCTMKDIILPQAFRHALPALANESIALLKETALISILGEEDLMRRSQLIAAEKYTYFTPLLVAAGAYYLMVLLLSYVFKSIEKRYA